MSHPTTKHRRKGHSEEEHENHERWLVSYADMLTLLFALFIVLYAIGQTDEKKYAALAAGLSKGFGSPLAAVSGGTGPLQNDGTESRPLELLTSVTSPQAGPALAPQVQKALDDIQGARRKRDAGAEADRLLALKRKIEKALAEQGLRNKAVLDIDQRGLVVSIVTDKVLFAAHDAQLQRSGQRVLDAIAPVLRTVPNEIYVEGHTNTAPVAPRGFSSDAALSSARAVGVLDYLVGRDVPRGRMTAIGRGDTRPLDPGNDEEANRRNRRVEVVLLSDLPSETRALLPEAADGHGADPGSRA